MHAPAGWAFCLLRRDAITSLLPIVAGEQEDSSVLEEALPRPILIICFPHICGGGFLQVATQMPFAITVGAGGCKQPLMRRLTDRHGGKKFQQHSQNGACCAFFEIDCISAQVFL